MRLRSGIQAKRLLNTEVGEWVRVNLPMGPALGWIVGTLEPIGRDIVCFPVTGVGQPVLQSHRADVIVLSLGMNCVLDPADVEGEFADGDFYRRRPGALSIGVGGAYLAVVDGRNVFGDVVELNVETGGHREDMTLIEALYAHWRLWATEEDRVTKTAKPLLDYRTKPHPPRLQTR